MQTVRFGKTGMKVSRLCLGCMTYGAKSWREWVLDEEASRGRSCARNLRRRNHLLLDTADAPFARRQRRDTRPRHQGRLRRATNWSSRPKFMARWARAPTPGAYRASTFSKAIDHSLKRLGTDYVDLYQIHRFDPDTPIEETIEALNDVVRAGKALYVGASSMYAWQFAKMNALASAKGHAQFVSMQNYYNLVYREEEREMMPYCESEGIAVIPWSPMARGYLAGSGVGQNAATLRGRTDPFSMTLGTGSEQGRSDPGAGRRDRARPRHEACHRRARLGAAQSPTLRRIDHWRLQGAPFGRRSGGGGAEELEPAIIARLEEPYRPKPIAGHA